MSTLQIIDVIITYIFFGIVFIFVMGIVFKVMNVILKIMSVIIKLTNFIISLISYGIRYYNHINCLVHDLQMSLFGIAQQLEQLEKDMAQLKESHLIATAVFNKLVIKEREREVYGSGGGGTSGNGAWLAYTRLEEEYSQIDNGDDSTGETYVYE
ncbi:hypothetical protein TWF569_003271 [Orbilia oligospora]|uniref:Uncharacterized protein n=1 Tax=Orbilia oligospora TaxID=2813651 RepID=A0A7C8JPA2_ORBOL|nr:hypothetical protein TWF706_011120 [Orbilia oligospora]KAF3130299.1 hypothetical protein TWF703_008288 [Orbilia oligospora]KAF3152237.1 hypothetical protein TWF569_003271 [Orbilia oligospora]